MWLRYAVGWAVDLVLAPGVRVGLLLGSFGVAFEPLVALPLYLLVAYTVTLLPLTPGGIGIAEATATAVFVARVAQHAHHPHHRLHTSLGDPTFARSAGENRRLDGRALRGETAPGTSADSNGG